MKPRVVFDSNVYISGLIFGGIPGALLVLARIDRFVLCVSQHIQDEVQTTLAKKFSWQLEQIRRACSPYWTIADFVKPTCDLKIVAADPDDDRILECAVDGNADIIVTGDDHLLNLGRPLPAPLGKILVMTPRQFFDQQTG
ncbi:MAG TPA: putative toxin-antitoxin system toxin component, PIN family [Bryobacteraceae bacterium]|jgi:putative PIN family toxin of toxin-antitoxin system|nr:putative toxin-antitoxin system toxin component, PIN family [Bryobacteraceae bacterium]